MWSTLLVLAATDVVSGLAFEKSNGLKPRLDNGLGKTPALGWNSWNQGGCNAATAAVALDTAQGFIDLGLKDAGYTYVNIDDCWSTSSRDDSGNLVPDPSKFPQGMKSLTDQIHAMGLKFGLYGDAGTKTCAGYPGSQGHEEQDAKLLASWGVDYWKHDNCYTPCNAGEMQTCTDPAGNTQTWYVTMRDALQSSGRPIFYSLCNWGRDSVWTWGADVGNSWRMSVDNWGGWEDVVRIASEAAPIASYSAPHGFNDLDMMIIGNGKLTAAEERAHFGIWAISKSPIFIGTDIRKLSEETISLFTNKGLLAVNQDPLGKAATTFRPEGAASPVSGQLYPYWAGPLSDGVVVGLVAPGGDQTLSVNFSDVPGLGEGTFSWTELYSGNTGSGTSVSVSLGAHDIAVFKVVSQAHYCRYVMLKISIQTSSMGQQADHEVNMYRRMAESPKGHPGRDAVRTLLDTFYIDGHGDKHQCLVHLPFFESILTFLRCNPVERLPSEVIAFVLLRLFLALDYLHTECQIVYTAPEVILEAPWTYSVDIWNVGCMIWDVYEGGSLFTGYDPEFQKYRSRAHLAEMINLLGPPPSSLLAQGELRDKFFSSEGKSRVLSSCLPQ
ncbi:hypothetical protein V501_06690 [Pseudogymnoascus sp. VKM F-4519 (FW-2642)]|nr:hypothetical protein V501_06690 [Pseudogymnoascus sp. VKM F-4519 (FW-2642)]